MTETPTPDPRLERIRAGVRESLGIQETFFRENGETILLAFERVTAALRAGGKLMILGNGGSAADAQHVAAELVNRFEKDRRALPALALTTDGSVLTCIGNDSDFRFIFSRQVEALGRPGDVLLAVTTSGNSPNVLEAVGQARRMGIFTLALTGGDGGRVRPLAHRTLSVSSSTRTCRIQEALFLLEHLLCEWMETELSSSAGRSRG
jgi:D-sedoheptulose 7-phosphate isomerase